MNINRRAIERFAKFGHSRKTITFKTRRGMVQQVIVLIIGLVVASILLGTIFLTGLGTLANGTKGSACTNCQAATKTLLNNTELIIVLAVFIAIIFGALAVVKIKGK